MNRTPDHDPRGTANAARDVRARVGAFVFAAGLALLAWMVTVEGEPGLLPLLLVAAGGTGWLVSRRRRR